MWRAVVLLTAALCGSARAFYPTWAIDEAVEKAYKDVEEMFSAETLRIGAHHVQDANSPEMCMYCIKGVTRHIMDSVVASLKEMCETTKCPYLQKKCKQAEEHPAVAYGYLLDHVHAMDKAVAYCYGRRVCPHPPVGGGGHCCCHGRCEHGNDVPSNLMPEFEFAHQLESMNLGSSPSLMGQSMLTLARNEEKNQTCTECIEGTACCVTEGAVHMIKQWCEKTECPCIKRVCEWAEEHRGVALGILIHRLRPGEWGCGYCFGKGTCQWPKPPNATDEVDHDSLVRKVLAGWF